MSQEDIDINSIKQWIHKEKEKIEKQLFIKYIIVVLLGAGEKEVQKREKIARKLEENGVIALIPEYDFPSDDVGPSLIEEAVLKEADVDLIFINLNLGVRPQSLSSSMTINL